MKDKYVFFIVTPSFNQAHFLKETIESVLNQKEYPVEYIVMDGGSTDETVKILRQYGKKIRWESKKDNGQTDAINKGIKAFQKLSVPPGTEAIFAYINSDDYYFPGTFAQVAEAFERHPEKCWLVGDCQIIDEHNREIHQPIRLFKSLLRSVYFRGLLAVLNPLPQPATFIRWSAVKKVGLFNARLRYVMDYEYWHRLQKHCGSPMLLHQTLAAFRIHGSSKGGTQFTRQFDEQYTVAQTWTHNPLFLFLHRVHNGLTTMVYKLIK